MEGLQLENFAAHAQHNEESVSQILKLSRLYTKSLEDEKSMTKQQKAIKNIGKQDPKRRLHETVNNLLSDNIIQNLASMIDTASFH